MSSLNSGAGVARLVGAILTPIAVLMAAVGALLLVTLPAAASGDDLIAAWTVTALSVVLSAVGVPMLVLGARRLARQRRVLRTGVPCRATVVAAHNVTNFENPRPVARISLAVPVNGGGAVTAVVRQVVPPRLAGSVRPGALLPVRGDPADPAFAVIDWEYAQERHRIAGSVDLAGALPF